MGKPLVAAFGHVDHGKSSFVKCLCDTSFKEEGDITQEIKAFNTNCGRCVILDTPGHHLFERMRSAIYKSVDFVLLIVDITQGLEKETTESIRLLREDRVPFCIVLTKIDKIHGFELEGYRSNPHYMNYFSRLQLQLSEQGFNSCDLENNDKPGKCVSIIPVSVKFPDVLKKAFDSVLLMLSKRSLKIRVDDDITIFSHYKGGCFALVRNVTLSIGENFQNGIIRELRILTADNRWVTVKEIPPEKVARISFSQKDINSKITLADMYVFADTSESSDCVVDVLKKNFQDRNIQGFVGVPTNKHLFFVEKSSDRLLILYRVKHDHPKNQKYDIISEKVIHRIPEAVHSLFVSRKAQSRNHPSVMTFVKNSLFHKGDPLLIGVDLLLGDLRIGQSINCHCHCLGTLENIRVNAKDQDMVRAPVKNVVLKIKSLDQLKNEEQLSGYIKTNMDKESLALYSRYGDNQEKSIIKKYYGS